jgi:hypothetical protein
MGSVDVKRSLARLDSLAESLIFFAIDTKTALDERSRSRQAQTQSLTCRRQQRPVHCPTPSHPTHAWAVETDAAAGGGGPPVESGSRSARLRYAAPRSAARRPPRRFPQSARRPLGKRPPPSPRPGVSHSRSETETGSPPPPARPPPAPLAAFRCFHSPGGDGFSIVPEKWTSSIWCAG